jgi:hypothetical protein
MNVTKNPEDALEAFIPLTFHDRNFQLGEFVRKHFSMGTVFFYYKERFNMYKPEQIGFRNHLRDFINLGFSLEMACYICVLESDGCHCDPDDFIEAVLSLDWGTEKESPHTDFLFKDADSEEPDTVASQFGSVFMEMSGIQESVKSDMTYKEAAAVLAEKLGRTVDIDEKIKEEKEAESEIEALMKELGLDGADLEKKQKEVYDIDDLDDLAGWTRGDTVRPNLEALMGDIKEFIHKTMKENEAYIQKFQSLDERGKMNLLIKSNSYFYIRKKAWDQIIENIHDPRLSNANFTVLTIKADELNTNKLCKALVNNQELLQEYIL